MLCSRLTQIQKHPHRARHVAIIMDGNGRWAQNQGKPRIWGHYQGLKALKSIIQCAWDLELSELTLFAFSQDNWKRSIHEVEALFTLLEYFLEAEKQAFLEKSIRIRHLGNLKDLPLSTQNLIHETTQTLKKGHRLLLNIAINYSGRKDILSGCRRLCQQVAAHELRPQDVTAEKLFSALDTHDLSEPDLLIRTSGEMRLSNFLLWHLAYTELWFSEVLWPDFTPEDFCKALEDYQKRERRFGSLAAGEMTAKEAQDFRKTMGLLEMGFHYQEDRGGLC